MIKIGQMTQSSTLQAIASHSATHVVAGSVFLAALSQVEVPFYPIPVTLQTLGVFLLAISQGAPKAAMSCLLYLMQASMGLPVLHGGMVNPLWFAGPTAGYLAAFPVAAYVIGMLLERSGRSVMLTMGSIFAGQVVIYSMGAGWLSTFVGVEQAIALGVVPFAVGAALKLAIATAVRVTSKAS